MLQCICRHWNSWVGLPRLAEQLVTCEDATLAELPAQLLGHTLIVRDLAAARAIAAHTSGYRFVTLQGELLEVDGTLTTGTHHAETGILSRKSELRELRQQAAELDRRSAEAERDLADAKERMTGLDSQMASLQEEIDVLAEQRGPEAGEQAGAARGQQHLPGADLRLRGRGAARAGHSGYRESGRADRPRPCRGRPT